MACKTRIERALRHSVTLPLNRHSRYAIFSDCHRGSGNMSDNFLRNRHLYFAALSYYEQKGFFYLELGDGEELWENRSRSRIERAHSEVYERFECLKRKKRFCKIYGNHDMELKKELPESILLENQEGGKNLHLIHGHQADFLNSTCWQLARFLVRYLWKPLEQFGVNDPTSAARNYKKLRKYEKCMECVAAEKDIYLMAGHSHRPHLAEGDLYINTGSCVHPWGITAIEITDLKLHLVKWFMGARTDGTLYVEREVLEQDVAIW